MWKNVEQNYVVEICELRKSRGFIQRQFGALKSCMWRDAAAKIMGIYTTSFLAWRERKIEARFEAKVVFDLMTSMREVEVRKRVVLIRSEEKSGFLQSKCA